jgi:hypothetical protein|tara:strand:- start:221 stop:370 length:150 start_codon:yes stop_codon:yes gene_type:complete
MKTDKIRQYRSNQGKSPQKMEKVYKGCFWILLAAILTVVSYVIYNLTFL